MLSIHFVQPGKASFECFINFQSLLMGRRRASIETYPNSTKQSFIDSSDCDGLGTIDQTMPWRRTSRFLSRKPRWCLAKHIAQVDNKIQYAESCLSHFILQFEVV